MRALCCAASIALASCLIVSPLLAADGQTRRLPVREYRDKMKAGWLGQMGGVTLGAPTENRYQFRLMPAENAPKWKPSMVNGAFGQDDLYVEMTFLRTLEQHGLDVSIRQAGLDFASSGYTLWCANAAGRNNLRKGIAPPDCSHPKFHGLANDIDYQIEADYSGLIAPGMPNAVIALGEKFGRLVNYGDGLYAGQFIGAAYAEAFFEKDMRKVVEAALRSIPEGSTYAEMVRDMLAWSKEHKDWEKCWDVCNAKYGKPEYRQHSTQKPCIDCRINGAYVVMGLLYGEGDPVKSMTISMRCGLDSDCNPSSSGGIVCTAIGMTQLPKGLMDEPNQTAVFSHTEYTFPKLLEVSEKLARQIVVRAGGRIEKDASGEEVFVIPVTLIKPSKLEKSWEPGPIAESRYTEAEMEQITQSPAAAKALQVLAPGWRISHCGTELKPGLRPEERGRTNVLVTHPASKDQACVLSRKLDIPADKRTVLLLGATHHPQGDWDLIVRVDGHETLKKLVSQDTVTDGWLDLEIDLTPWAGKSVRVEVLNQPNGWAWEAAYWSKLQIQSH